MKIQVIDSRVDQKWQSFYIKTVTAYLNSLPENIQSLFASITVTLLEPIHEVEVRMGQHMFFTGGLEPTTFIHLYPKRFQDHTLTDVQQFDLLTTMLNKCVDDLTKQTKALQEIHQSKHKEL